MTVSTALIQELADCRDRSLAGGKAVNLGEMMRADFPVPGGFVVTTTAYRIARELGNGHIPAAVAEEIRHAYRKLGSPPVAVRSSATAEDMSEASMAGQYETFLDVNTEEALLDAVRCCWASLDSPRTRAYLTEHGICLSTVAMGVVVQRLVAAEVAGVLFCANPRTGSRAEMLIEASWGLGEAVVSGRVQPDVLRIDRDTGSVVHAAVADKQVWIPPGQGEEHPVDEARRRLPCLRSSDVFALWRLGRRASDHFGAPQDIEFALRDGQLYMLQSRPITTLAGAEAYEQLLQTTRARLRQRLDEGRGPWVLHNISETLSHPTPLTWSVIRRFMSGSGGFGAMYRMAGFEPSARVRAEGFLERIAGKLYMDLSLAPEMFFEAYPFKYDLSALRSNPDAAQAPPTIPAGPLAARFRAAGRAVVANRRVHELAEDFDRRLTGSIIPEFVAWCVQEKQRNLAKLSPAELVDRWHHREHQVLNQFAPQALLPSLISAMALAELQALLGETCWDEDPNALAAMLASAHAPDRTVRASAELYEVARNRRSIDQWLEQNAHRAPEEFDLATPRWRERREELSQMIERLEDGIDPTELHRASMQKTAQKLDELRSRLEPADRAELDRRLALARRYLPFREDAKHFLMLGYDLLRDLALEAGRRLEIGSDVFQLTLEELFDALRVGFAPLHLISERKRAYDAESRIVLPHVIDAADIDGIGEPHKIAHAGQHTAFAVSIGTASGPVRIVRSPHEAAGLGKGYILVCPSTDPGWTPLFINAAGVVMECGGTLSHGAVVAREMRIPAVVLPDATRLFDDGEMIAIDGRNGMVMRAREMAEAPAPSVDPDPADTRIPRRMVPPPAGRRERAAARLRNVGGLVWTVYLLGVFLLPESWLYTPSLKLFDRVLWPLVAALGMPATVAIAAAGLAILTMVLQRLLTDNARLREASRRARQLVASASSLPKDSPRWLAMHRLAAPVQLRVVGASFVPLAVLLGPMVMMFLWFPNRVDPASWNAPPGSAVSVIATVDGEFRDPVTLTLLPPLEFDETSPPARTLSPIRHVLERKLREWERPTDLSSQPWELEGAARAFREAWLQSLRAFLAGRMPPQTLAWRIRSDQADSGKFPVTLSAPGEPPLAIDVVLGNRHPPGPMKIDAAAGSALLSLEVKYPPPPRRPIFWAPFHWTAHLHDRHWLSYWDAGWLITYLLAYLPAMFASRWALGVV